MMTRFLVGSLIASITVAPFVPHTHVVGNLAWADFLIAMLAPIVLMQARFRIHWWALIPLILASLSILSLSYNFISGSYGNNVPLDQLARPLGHVSRWIYFSLLIVVVASLVRTPTLARACLYGILGGVVTTVLWSWYVWLSAPVFVYFIPMLHVIRGSDLIINRNFVGFFIGIGVCLSFALAKEMRGLSPTKIALLGIFAFLAMSSALTMSKGAWVTSLGPIVIYYLVIACRHLQHLRVPVTYLGVLLLLLAGSSTAYATFHGPINNYFSVASLRITSENFNDMRIQLVRDSSKLMFSNPILGVGPSNYGLAATQEGLIGSADPHNAILWVGAELGLFAAVAMSIMIVNMCWYLFMRSSFISDTGTRAGLQLLMLTLLLNMPLQGLSLSMKPPLDCCRHCFGIQDVPPADWPRACWGKVSFTPRSGGN